MADEYKFKVGDRVVATANHDYAAITGLCGTIVTIDDFAPAGYGVEFDVDFFSDNNPARKKGHYLGGAAKECRGWWIPEDKLALADSHKDPFEQVGRVSKPPKLDTTNLLKCIIASKSYPYATLDTTGALYFYSDLPKGIVVFETTAVKR